MPKAKRLNKKKTSNVIPIKKDVLEKEDQLMSIEEQERERTNKFARKICDEIDDYEKILDQALNDLADHLEKHISWKSILDLSKNYTKQ